jgi:hypothetical protein
MDKRNIIIPYKLENGMYAERIKAPSHSEIYCSNSIPLRFSRNSGDIVVSIPNATKNALMPSVFKCR